MAPTPEDLEQLLLKLRYDTTAMQAKITDALTMLGTLALRTPGEHVCPRCGVERPSAQLLAEHLELLHDQPVETT